MGQLAALTICVGLAITGTVGCGDESDPGPGASSADRVAPGRAVHSGKPARAASTQPARPAKAQSRKRFPSAEEVGRARKFANGRGAAVSFAVVDSDGAIHGLDEHRTYSSASVVKAMLLAAELRRLKQAGERVDAQTDDLLRAMITDSDNDAADAIYARVGDAGLLAVAHRARMRDYSVAGYWGNSQISAADMALMFADLDRAFARRDREYAKGLLGSVVAEHSWGIPEVAGERWAVRFKGGWLPDQALVHQAAELQERDGSRKLAIVVLTDSQPSFEYGIDTVAGVAGKLLRR